MSQTEKATDVTVSQTALQGVLNDIRNGNTDYVDSFFAARPDWQDKTNEQTDDKQKEAAQA